MFIRVFRPPHKELLINVNSIWKIEVQYAVPDPKQPGHFFHTDLQEGLKNAEAVRCYAIYFGSENVMLMHEDNEAFKVIEDIYKSAKKG